MAAARNIGGASESGPQSAGTPQSVQGRSSDGFAILERDPNQPPSWRALVVGGKAT